MTDWLKELSELPAEKNNIRGGCLLPKLTEPVLSIVSVPTEPIKPDCCNALDRLERIAKWRNHPLDDLLDWYKNDMEDLAQKSI